MDLIQKLGLLFNQFRRREAARLASNINHRTRREASAEKLYDAVCGHYPIKRRRDLPQLSDEAYANHVREVVATRELMATIVAGWLVRKAASKATPEDDLDTIHRKLEF
jgi:hypothetical protein